MEVSKLSQELKHIDSANGCTLNIEERARLDLAFETLKADLPSNHLFFWGKIRGNHFFFLIRFPCRHY